MIITSYVLVYILETGWFSFMKTVSGMNWIEKMQDYLGKINIVTGLFGDIDRGDEYSCTMEVTNQGGPFANCVKLSDGLHKQSGV